MCYVRVPMHSSLVNAVKYRHQKLSYNTRPDDLTGRTVPNPLECTLRTRLEVIKTWIQNCDAKHYARRTRSATLPTRVIDVDLSAEAHRPHLVLASSISREINVRYTALSHCWGSSGKNFRATKKNLYAHTAALLEPEPPKIFVDAILIIRGLLIRYLWINPICIVQDDDADWSQESGTMAAI